MDASGSRSYDDVAEVGDLYDLVAPYVGREDVGFYVAATRGSSEVLELGCGTGRVLIPIARAGTPIVGLDQSPAMLERCKAKVRSEAEDVQRRIHLRIADIRSFDLGRRFESVIAPFRPLQHLIDVADQLSCLTSVRRHLAPGGRFIFDVFNPDLARLATPSDAEHEDTPRTALPGNRSFRRTARVVRIDRLAQVSQVELTYHVTDADGKEERRTQAFPMRWYFRHELEHLLARAGFAIAEIYGSIDRTPLRQDSPEMVVIATVAPASRP